MYCTFLVALQLARRSNPSIAAIGVRRIVGMTTFGAELIFLFSAALAE